ncbi:MAG: hypothetical protein OEY27_09330, partial [Gammaproteobacteria bacterium]|nr:hypothetical protein [Gammaproteobacteria bacterium]
MVPSVIARRSGRATAASALFRHEDKSAQQEIDWHRDTIFTMVSGFVGALPIATSFPAVNAEWVRTPPLFFG